mmetsp:Transcript_4256/g.7240  ORF Transcript_4256/g.7240 Transcript_4256/m.7240 type:complete len:94 (-) Transcript_4256:3159-3440(-)
MANQSHQQGPQHSLTPLSLQSRGDMQSLVYTKVAFPELAGAASASFTGLGGTSTSFGCAATREGLQGNKANTAGKKNAPQKNEESVAAIKGTQ